MPNLYEIADQFRNDLLAGERGTAKNLLDHYGAAYQRIRFTVDDILAQMKDYTNETGKKPSKAWLFQRSRLQSLLEQVQFEMRVFAHVAESEITAGQQSAIIQAKQDAHVLMQAALGPGPVTSVSFSVLPTEQAVQLVGTLQNGSPLRALLDELGPEASAGVQKELVSGLLLGLNPRVIARNIRAELGGNLVRALTISRTEILRAYRTTALQTYQENDDVVDGWIWVAKLGGRTCPVCIALNGSIHPLSERFFGTHPRCRCAPCPRTKSWAELGFDDVSDDRPEIEKGADWFARQPPETQREILGPKKFEAYTKGEVTLQDLVGYENDPKWGPVRFERSLVDAVAAAN